MPLERRRVVQILDVTGPLEVFARTARRLVDRGRCGQPAYARRAPVDRVLVRWLRRIAPRVRRLASVCTGAFLLAEAGLLDGRRATTHWRSLDWMRQSFPAVTVEDTLHVVEDGQVLTSAGISAGIDMALRVVARGAGPLLAPGRRGYPGIRARVVRGGG